MLKKQKFLKEKSTNILLITYCLTLCILVLIPFFLEKSNEPFLSLNFEKNIADKKWSENWSAVKYKEEAKTCSFPYSFSINKNETLSFEKTISELPKNKKISFALHADVADFTIKNKNKDKIIYSHELSKKPMYKNDKNLLWHIVDLSSAEIGDVIQLVFSFNGPEEKSAVYSIENILVGSVSSILLYISIKSIKPLFLSLIILALLFSSLLIYSFLSKSRLNKKNPLYLAIFAFMIYMAIILDMGFFQFFPSNASTINLFLALITALVILPVIYSIRENNYFLYKDFLTLLCSVVAIITTVITVLIALKKIEINTLSIVGIFIYIVCLSFLCLVTAYLYFKERKKSILKLLIIISFSYAILLLNIYAFFHGKISGFVYIFIGSLIFIMYMLIDTVYDAISLIKESQEALYFKSLATIDEMTGLKNANAYIMKIKEYEENPKSLENTGIIISDLNSLKYINDNFGHNTGDEAIKIAANAIKTTVDKNYDCYRIGGDEYACIVENTDSESLEKFKAEIYKKLKDQDRDLHFNLEIATGYTIYDKNLDKNLEDTAKRADFSMYEEKTRQKQRKTFHGENF